ncbi:hypothetical protein [Actinoplanes palleronii]|uniref:SHOCT domain-containing protein n=1 Tax=Actinoplanes palleronii TaxID=113570 RepID=A0ABQ4BBY2_9ACTN|nr:hypothetical protein [Actinoplanes palleronii]GIE68206.1 hypothetical protein Apa02nite_043140 [Actinoplanes palleronii]
MTALLLIAAVLLLVRVAGALALAFSDRVPRPGGSPGRRVDPCLGPLLALPAPPVRTPHPQPGGTLLDRLRSGQISRAEYRARMAAVAARDARIHPLR